MRLLGKGGVCLSEMRRVYFDAKIRVGENSGKQQKDSEQNVSMKNVPLRKDDSNIFPNSYIIIELSLNVRLRGISPIMLAV